jgi:hypothetical protein
MRLSCIVTVVVTLYMERELHCDGSSDIVYGT